jgi:kynureninase
MNGHTMEVCHNDCKHIHSPRDILNENAKKWQMKMASEEFARKLDQTDSLHYLREEFYYPTIGSLSQSRRLTCITFQNELFLQFLADKSNINYSSSDSVYLCSHSLGLQPKRVRKWIDMWINDWANL